MKNRAPAPTQITAEQLIREAREADLDGETVQRKDNITTKEELDELKVEKRTYWENRIRRNRYNVGLFLKYAKFEERLGEWRRARSIFERAIDVDYKKVSVWERYAEFEQSNKFINHARNVFDRAVELLPRADSLWQKFTFMEEMLGKVENARVVFERWVRWEPDANAWQAYISLEERQGDLSRARAIYDRFTVCHPESSTFVKFAKWEERNSQIALARGVFERAVSGELGEDDFPSIYLEFFRFEARQREYARARAILKYAIDVLPKEDSARVRAAFIAFEKQHGDRKSVESNIFEKRRKAYADALTKDPHDYDSWLDLCRLEEECANSIASSIDRGEGETVTAKDIHKVEAALDAVRAAYDRAVANEPDETSKDAYRRFVYLHINYALFEELQAANAERARIVLKKAIASMPKGAAFSKLFMHLAHFEIRQKRLGDARTVFGYALGIAPRPKLFREYTRIEMKLGEIDRVRKIYEKWVETFPSSSESWLGYTALESRLGETERARWLHELALKQTVDAPELLWNSFISLESAAKKYDAAVALYERLLKAEVMEPATAFIAYAQFCAEKLSPERAREIFERGVEFCKTRPDKEKRVLLLHAWKNMESENGNDAQVKKVQGMLPMRVKKKRPVFNASGETDGWEEYFDYVFPEDASSSGLKLLEAARKWKAARRGDGEDAADEHHAKKKRRVETTSGNEKVGADANEIELDDDDDDDDNDDE